MKKLKSDIEKNFAPIAEDELNSVVNIKDEFTLMKIETAEGQICTIYLVGKNPIVFIYGDKMYPTIYFLWQAPNILPSFATFEDVLPRIANGADLMLPGVVVDHTLGVRAYGKLPKDTPVYVNTTVNSAAIAVGKTWLSSEDMYMAARKGKAVEILHYLGDCLHQLSGKISRPNLQPLTKLEGAPTDVAEVANNLNNIHVDATTPEASEYSDVEVKESAKEEVEEPKVTPQEEVDTLLKYCFVKSLKTTAKKLDLPCLTNVFYANHILPACPKSKSLDIKKSSFKKLSKFLAFMQEQGVIGVKEQSKGVEAITEINYGHEILRGFKEEFLEEEEEEDADEEEERYEAPAVTDVYCVTAAVLPIFRQYRHEKGVALTSGQVKQVLTEYIKSHDLQHPEQKSVVRLDQSLSNALLEQKEKNENPALTWERLMQRCLNKMSKAYCISFPGQEPVLKKGELKPIELSVATRSGNKKVTLVSGLDTFGINLTEFAHKCQVGVAASTTIVTSPDKKGPQVLVQGNQVAFASKLLFDEYKLQKKYVKGAEGAVTKPRKKK
ncbi:eukaryotic translation initiation factor 2D-like isoform X2 [Artemia franciscana]|uniref:eukaryotic translation initiation factor 2D-like isoform X2 n=1 Tax=Artemia franciscana TaxID=6661 RepID=UPI0032DA3876